MDSEKFGDSQWLEPKIDNDIDVKVDEGIQKYLDRTKEHFFKSKRVKGK